MPHNQNSNKNTGAVLKTETRNQEWKFQCTECDKSYKIYAHLSRHKSEAHATKYQAYMCPDEECSVFSSNIDVMKSHAADVHGHLDVGPSTPSPLLQHAAEDVGSMTGRGPPMEIADSKTIRTSFRQILATFEHIQTELDELRKENMTLKSGGSTLQIHSKSTIVREDAVKVLLERMVHYHVTKAIGAKNMI